MEYHIWRHLIQILSYRKDLIDIIKPFLEQLNSSINNEQFSINEEKHISFLKLLSSFQLEVLHEFELINEDIYKIANIKKDLIIRSEKNEEKYNIDDEIRGKVKEIIKGDRLEDFQKLINERGINAISPIIKSFNEIEKMEIPIIIECIIQKASKCFKYLLINEIEEPTITMQNSGFIIGSPSEYEWNCMAIAIYYGEIGMMKILEDKGTEKGNQSSHIEAAIFSFRNPIIKEIMNRIKEKDEETIKIILNKGILTTIKSNNISGFEFLNEEGKNMIMKLTFDSGRKPLHIAVENNSKEMIELLIKKGANINAIDIIFQIIIIFLLTKTI